MRPLFLCLALTSTLCAAESPRVFPLWDGKESIEAYAAKVNLPTTKSIPLAHGVSLDLVLIPAGQFEMGSPKPAPPHVTQESADTICFLGLLATGLLIFALTFQCVRKSQVAFSLRWLMCAMVAGGMLAGGAARRSLAFKEGHRFENDMALYNSLPNDEKPAHSVTITWPFYMGKYTVTQEQFEAVMKSNSSQFTGAKMPVERVDWDEASKFCTDLRPFLGDAQCSIHLPTEAQWEFACRAGTRTAFYFGDDAAGLDDVAWNNQNSGGKPHLVGAKKENAFGLYDMYGNVWQWCRDWYGDEYYKYSVAISVPDPKGFGSGPGRVLRGGSWLDGRVSCRSAARAYVAPEDSRYNIGFRIVIEMNP